MLLDRPQRTEHDRQMRDTRAVLLEPEQEQLLGTLAEASRSVPERSERVFDLIILAQVTLVSGPGLGQGGLHVEDDDIDVLEQEGFVRVLSRGRGLVRFRVTPEGDAHAENGKTRSSAAVDEVAPRDPKQVRARSEAIYRKSSVDRP